MPSAVVALNDVEADAVDVNYRPALLSGGAEAQLLRALMGRVDQQDAAAFNNLGVLYHSRGLHSEAVEAFLKALELEPRMRAAVGNLEIAALVPDACSKHLSDIQKQIDAAPENRGLLLQRAKLLRLIGQLEIAANQLDQLIAQDADDSLALFERGLIDQRSGDLRRAQRWFERAVNAGAGDSARLHLAEVLYQLGQNEQALDQSDLLLDRSPHYAEAWLLRGFILGDMGHHEQAMESTRRASALSPLLETGQRTLSIAVGNQGSTPLMSVEPSGIMAKYGLGLAFRQRGYFAEARVEFERAAEHGEDQVLVQHALAELDLVEGFHSAARQRLEHLLTGGDNSRWWMEHGVARHQAGALDDAMESYRRALRLDPRNALAYNNLGVALADSGDDAAAKDSLLRASELDPSLVRARRNLAILLVRQNELLAALSLLRELTTFHRNDAESWYLNGTVLARLDKLEEARDAFVQAIACMPRHADARFALSDVLEKLGDGDGAVRETQQALAISPVRSEPSLTVEIGLHSECPDAVGSLNILRLVSESPLTGVTIDAESIDSLLKEQEQDRPQQSQLERVQAILAEADAFAERTLYGEAFERYERARAFAESDDSIKHLWHRAAMGEVRSRCLLHRSENVQELLEQLGKELPSDPEIWALTASSLIDERHENASESTMESPIVNTSDGSAVHDLLLRLLRSSTRSAGLLHFAGDLAMRAGESQLALGLYRRSLASDPVRPSPRVSIARVLRLQGNMQAALLELTAALAVAPAWRDALLELAILYRQSGRSDEARSVLAGCLLRAPTDIAVLEEMVAVLIDEERVEDARIAIKRLARHDPHNSLGQWYESILYVHEGRIRDAMARWRELEGSSTAGVVAGWAAEALARAAQGSTSIHPDGREEAVVGL